MLQFKRATRRRVLGGKMLFAQLVGTFAAVMNHCSQDSITGPCPEPDVAYHLHTLPSFSSF